MTKDATVLRLQNLTKTYILGRHSNAKKAQKAILKEQKKYEKLVSASNHTDARKLEKRILKAENLFADEKYTDSYKLLTGKTMKHKKAKGSVVHALNGVNLEIKKGEMVAIVGPSGSGKSTLLNMLGLLDKPTAGQIYLNGQNVADLNARSLPAVRSDQLGFVFQSFNLVPTLTAIENVMLPLKYSGVHGSRRHELAKQALEQVGLGNRINHQTTELSGGQQQRVAIARSIVGEPAIVFGDELTGELDSKMTEEVMKLVRRLNKGGQTFVIVTHNPDVAKQCKRVIHMLDGKIERETRKK